MYTYVCMYIYIYMCIYIYIYSGDFRRMAPSSPLRAPHCESSVRPRECPRGLKPLQPRGAQLEERSSSLGYGQSPY